MTDYDLQLFHGAIAVDLDGTLAHYDGWKGAAHIGDPVPTMAKRLEGWLKAGIPVVILTARVWSDGSEPRNLQADLAYDAIKAWLRQHFGVNLPVTCVKNPGMISFYDDRAVAIEKNTGRVMAGQEVT